MADESEPLTTREARMGVNQEERRAVTGIDEDAAGDGPLWRAVQAGSTTAFEALYRRHATVVYVHCKRQMAGHQPLGDLDRRCEDASSETFLHTWRRRDSIEIETTLLPWLLGTATHVCNGTLRSERRNSRLLYRIGAAEMPPGARSIGAENDVSNAELLLSVQAALARMGPQEALIARMCILEDVAQQEAARRLDLSDAALRSGLHRVRRALRRELASFRLDVAAYLASGYDAIAPVVATLG